MSRRAERKGSEQITSDISVDEHYACKAGDNAASGVQKQDLKNKIRLLQEDVDYLSSQYYEKDNENVKLAAKIKDLEEDRARLLKNTNLQQTQMEKQKALTAESAKKCDRLQLQVSTMNKEIEKLNWARKQAAAAHSNAELRLTKALEEVEWSNYQLNKIKLQNKENMSVEQQSKEELFAENKLLKKQKAELIVGFKKQLKLIDNLKKQKMHIEASTLLHFTQEEFKKAINRGKS